MKKCHINNVCLLSLFYFLKKLILFNINHIYLSLAFAIFPNKTNTFPKKRNSKYSKNFILVLSFMGVLIENKWCNKINMYVDSYRRREEKKTQTICLYLNSI